MTINLLKMISLLALLITTTLFAQDISGLSIVSKSVPYEIELLIEHLKASPLSKDEKQNLIARLDLINSDLKGLDSKELMFLLKSETYRSILTNQYLQDTAKLQVNQTIIKSINKKLEKNKVIYASFSNWIIETILNDLSPFMADNFLTRYQSVDRSNPKDLLRAKRVERVLKYISPMLSAFLSMSPEEFNSLTKKIALDTIERLTKKSFYFKEFARKSDSGSDQLFIIPEISLTPEASQPIKEDSMEEDSASQKAKAQETVEDLGESDMSSASKAIDVIAPENAEETEQ